jgi:5-methylcytosine-specific restriction protein B
MALLNFLTNKAAAAHDATAKLAVINELKAVFPEDSWNIEIEVSEYTAENIANLWSNELRKPLKAALEAESKSKASFSAWLGDIHFVNVRIAPKRIFQRSRSNQGWRISMMALPAAGVIGLGIASHYQGGQNHNALGRASAFLRDVAAAGMPDGNVLPGREAEAEDWDGTGLFTAPVRQVDGVTVPVSSDNGMLSLKSVRTTTVKKILASFISIEAVAPSVGEAALVARLEAWRDAALTLSTSVPPYTSVQDFEALRALALQDLAAASLRLQLSRKSATRSTVRIFYGPPGTGKTLTAVRDAVKLVDVGFDDGGDPSVSFARFNALTDQVAFLTFHQALQYEDAIESIRPTVQMPADDADKNADADADVEEDAEVAAAKPTTSVAYRLHEGVILRMIRAALEEPAKEFVVVIDEINRGDISRILGPLISALEPDKRLGAEYPISVELQYPRAGNLEPRLFLPANLHFLGTMNSADRNIALVDHALRRRFDFVLIPPEPALLRSTPDANPIDLAKLLSTINHRITHVLGAEYAIGHGYFMSCESNEDVIRTMARKLLPLLEEYFFGNPGLMLLVLGEAPGADDNMHVITEPNTAYEMLFNLSREQASALGYRSQETGLGVVLDPRFWNGNKLLPGPDDEAYAVRAVQKIYADTVVP